MLKALHKYFLLLTLLTTVLNSNFTQAGTCDECSKVKLFPNSLAHYLTADNFVTYVVFSGAVMVVSDMIVPSCYDQRRFHRDNVNDWLAYTELGAAAAGFLVSEIFTRHLAGVLPRLLVTGTMTAAIFFVIRFPMRGPIASFCPEAPEIDETSLAIANSTGDAAQLILSEETTYDGEKITCRDLIEIGGGLKFVALAVGTGLRSLFGFIANKGCGGEAEKDAY